MDELEVEKRINKGIAYRSMTLQIRKAESEKEENDYIVEGYATTFNEPYCMGENEYLRVMEQVSDKAFDNADMTDVIAQYDHQGHVYARISNNTLTLEKDEHGLKVRMYLGGTTEGKKLYEEIKGGYTTKMSFGFTITAETRSEKTTEDGKTEVLYTIDSIGKLYDVSAVSLPANDGTDISARNLFNTEVEKRNEAEAEKLKAEEEKKHQEEEQAEKDKRARWLFVHKNNK